MRLTMSGILLAAAIGGPAVPAQAAPGAPTVDLALSGRATADTAADGHAAAAAADGDAATAWCPAGPSGTLTVDLARPRPLAGFGLTLLGGVPATATIATATAPGRFRVVRSGAPVAAGTPTWFPGRAVARWVRLTVTGGSGAAPCVGELRALGRGPAMIIGHDLSFAVQETAAGATYTGHGRPALPERILAYHGANYVRLRLWVNPPAGYSDLPGVLAMARRAKAAGLRLLLDPHYSDRFFEQVSIDAAGRAMTVRLRDNGGAVLWSADLEPRTH